MSVVIKDVAKGSLADSKAIKPLDVLVSINKSNINDFFDYQFHLANDKITLCVLRNCKYLFFTIIKEAYDDIGLEFDTYLMDKHKTCKNKCIFCFIDQMPTGMRDSLYFKDDDDRLSYLFGNYITLTNLYDEDIDRIINMKISPINISVHTTNPQLRVKMMKNKSAGDKLSYIEKLTSNGITVNTQLVLCPTINDGQELVNSLNDLSRLHPYLNSIACVPVGLTKFRDGLTEILPYTKKQAEDVIDIINDFGAKFYKEHKKIIAFASDEFYIIAKRELPDASHYGDFVQLDNGVGMISLFMDRFNESFNNCSKKITKPVKKSIATGEDAFKFIKSAVDKSMEKWHNLLVDVYPIKNKFFGDNITVTGLLTGMDIMKQLKGKKLGKELLLSECMFKSNDEQILLDDVTVEQLEKELNVIVKIVKNDGEEFLNALLD